MAELEVMGKKINVKIEAGSLPKFVHPIIVEEGPQNNTLSKH